MKIELIEVEETEKSVLRHLASVARGGSVETISIDGHTYGLVCRRESNGCAIYRGAIGYARVGPATKLHRELAIHKRLAVQGFPVATLLSEGNVGSQAYFVESDLGEIVFGELFEGETQQHGCIFDASFRAYLMVVRQWAIAQLQNASSVDARHDFAHIIRFGEVQSRLPDLVAESEQAFTKAMTRLCAFPSVWTHGDFHPYNVCHGGVIDLEMVRFSVAGYDVITGLLDQDLYPPDPTAYRFSPGQMQTYLSDMDQIYRKFHLPPPSAYVDDYRMCKMMANVWLARNRPAGQQQWIYQHYRQMVRAYIHPLERHNAIWNA